MSRVDEIKSEIETLSDNDFSHLREWLAEKDWEKWDEKIEAHSAKGDLDFLVEEARDEQKKGKLEDL